MPQRSSTEQVEDRVGLWKQAYDLVREETTPPTLRTMLTALLSRPVDSPEESMTVLQSSFALAQLVSANDRAAAAVAAELIQYVKTPTRDVE